MTKHQPIVEELIALLKSRPDLADALKESIRKAARPDVLTFPQYDDFFSGFLCGWTRLPQYSLSRSTSQVIET